MAHKPKILVVENDAATLRQLETSLKTMGAEPRCLASAVKAAEAINKEKFDGAFLDWDTPELNGEGLTQRIRASRSNGKIPIAMITERSDARSITVGFKVGVNFFLSKPIGQTELSRLLNATRGSMLEERRRYLRVPFKNPVACASGEKKGSGQGVNLSITGLLVALAPGPAVGTEVTLEFSLPGGQKLALAAVVARLGPGGQVGLKFVKPNPEQRELLKAYVDRHMSLSGGS